ncbi:hypothetical protein HDU96_005256, partial [Phlyctochytrium bullatum]
FFVMKDCPEAIILGVPTIRRFRMDILSSSSRVRFFSYDHSLRETKVHHTPLKLVPRDSTYANPKPFIAIVATERTTLSARCDQFVPCRLKHSPKIDRNTYTVHGLEANSRQNIHVRNGLFSKGYLVNNKTFSFPVTYTGTEDKTIPEGFVLGYVVDDDPISMDIISEIPEPVLEDPLLMLTLLSEFLRPNNITSQSTMLNHFHAIATGETPPVLPSPAPRRPRHQTIPTASFASVVDNDESDSDAETLLPDEDAIEHDDV